MNLAFVAAIMQAALACNEAGNSADGYRGAIARALTEQDYQQLRALARQAAEWKHTEIEAACNRLAAFH